MNKHFFTHKRFLPLFLTQFLGAFNDNFFKNALIILITYRAYRLGGLDSKMMVAICSALFILPFFLFSSIAGQLTDKFSKTQVARWTKLWEVLTMVVGAFAFYFSHIPLLIFTLFMMGTQSTFFGPVKYGILPELLERDELVGGNAYVEMGTFISILLGTVAGGVLISFDRGDTLYVPLSIVVIALLGQLTAFYIPHKMAQDPRMKVDWNVFTSTYSIIKKARRDRSVWYSIMGISWFWAVGSVFLTVIPLYGKNILSLHPYGVTFLMAIFSVGIGLGSLLCEKLSHRRLEVGMLPFGAIGMSFAAYDLFKMGIPHIPLEAGSTFVEFFSRSYSWRICFDLLLLSACGGLYIVPLYSLIQIRARASERAQIIAATNIINSFFMVMAAVSVMAFFAFKLSFIKIFSYVALANLGMAIIIYLALPEFFYRFVCYLITSAMYRVRLQGEKNIPLEGPCLMVANHVSFVDWMLLLAISPRPIRFVMHQQYYRLPLLNKLFKQMKHIEIAGPFEDRTTFLNSFDDIQGALEKGEVVCLFPEGEITRTGKMNPFKRGIEKVLQKTPVPVIPVVIDGMWGSFFSRKKGGIPFSRVWSKIELTVGEVQDTSLVEELEQWIVSRKKDEVV